MIGIIILLTIGGASAAQGPGARAPANTYVDPRAGQARKACAAGDVGLGVDLLAAMLADNGDANTVYNQGRCYEQNGHLRAARERFREYARLAAPLPPAEREALEGHIIELDMMIAAQRNTLTPPRQEPRKAAETTAVAPASTELAAKPLSLRRRTSALRIGAYSLAAAGIASVATGIYFGRWVVTIENEINRPTGQLSVHRFKSLWRQGDQAERGQWISYGLGAAALSSAAILYFLSQ